MRKFITHHWIWLFALGVCVLLLTRNLWGTRAWIETHDGIFHLIRQDVFVSELKTGQFPVHWASSLDNGFGLPLFNYIYPGPYYLGSFLSLLGIGSKWVIKLLTIGLYLLGGVGVYTLFSGQSRRFAFISSLLYLTTPYLLVNIFVRGALGEFMAISLIPWVLVSMYDLSQTKSLRWYHPIPYALLFLSHNFLSFLFLPIYLILIMFHKSSAKLIITSLVLSLGLSSFFILPMILERGYLTSVTQGNYTYNFADHFIYPIQLIYSRWGIGHSYSGLNDGFSFMLGFANLSFLLVGIIISFLKKDKNLILWTVLSLAVIFFLLPVALPLWQIFTPLQIMQFPWRLLSFTTITIPILSFYLLTSLKSKLVQTILMLSLALNMLMAYQYSKPYYFQSNDQLASQLYIHSGQTTTSSRREVLPKWTSEEEKWIGEEHVRIVSGPAEVSNLVVSASKVTFTASTMDPSTIFRIRRNYFPSWIVVDETGRRYQTSPTEDGLIDFHGSTGTHTYTAYVGSTATQMISNWISLLTLIFILANTLRPRLKKYIDTHFKEWDISIALRYLPIVDALKKNSKPSDKVLEIGSEITGITTYYPRRVTGLDQGFDYKRRNKYLSPVEGSAVSMPFKDNSFDYVVSVDCIEHIPPKLREKAVGEMLRVARKQIYLTFPVGAHSQAVDQMLDQYFFKKNGTHFTYLTEHVDNGLPGFDFIPKIVAKHKNWSLVSKGNTTTWLWVLLLKMGFSNVQWQTSIYRRLLLLLPLLKHFNFGACYRQLYIITRDKS